MEMSDNQSLSTDNINSFLIPLPCDENMSNASEKYGSAWERAKEALKKVKPAASSATSSQVSQVYNQHNAENTMQQQGFSWLPYYNQPFPAMQMSYMYQPDYENMYSAPFHSAYSSYRFFAPPRHPPPPPSNPPMTSDIAGNQSKKNIQRPSTARLMAGMAPAQSRASPSTVPCARPYQGNNSQNSHPIRFIINRPPIASANMAFSKAVTYKPPNNYSSRSLTIPPEVSDYVERSYLAVNKAEDRDKLEEYFVKKLNPLLISGAYKTVDWKKEPLPSDLNFQVRTQWIPASELKKGNSEVSSALNRRSRKVGDSNRSDSSSKNKSKKRKPSNGSESLDESPDFGFIPIGSNDKLKRNIRRKKKGKNQAWVADAETAARREQRAKRFARGCGIGITTRKNFYDDYTLDFGVANDSKAAIVGTFMEIEKSYFRLTTMPDPSTIRPLHILEKSLHNVKEKYGKHHDYRFANDQLRSIRQDLMIQRIRSTFTVQVYETNARIAIEQGDREEFNQCQSQLKLLYKELPNCANEYEFTSYRLLYYISVADFTDLSSLMCELSAEAKRDECVKFATDVRQAWALCNNVRIFRLYSMAPRMCSYVMDLFLDRERKAFLDACLKSYRPTISVSDLSEKLCISEYDTTELLARFGIKANEDDEVDCRIHSKALDTVSDTNKS